MSSFRANTPSEHPTATPVTPPGPEAEPSGDTTRTRGAGDQAERVLRRTRRLTDVFAWFTAVGVLASALSPGRHGTLGVVAAVLVVVVLICWATGHPRQEWWLVGVEAVTVAVGCFALAAVEPLLGLLFGLTTRRAARGRLGRYALKGAPPLAAYLVGVLNVRLGAGADQLAPVLLPLVGLVIGSLALGDTISAVSFARAAGRANAAAHERLSAIVRTTPVALVVVDPTNRVTLSNDLARELITACGGDEHHVPCPHGIDAFACAHGCLDALRTTGRTEWTYGHTESPRTVAVYGTSTADEHGQPTQLWALVDISDTKALEDELRRRLERDHLTGVVSREHFAELLQSTLDGNPGGRLALLVVDLDNFKEINDAFGHPLGDVFLIASARQLRHTVGTAGVVGRLGGDEFAVLAVDHDEHDAAALAARVLTALSSVRQVEGYTSALTASIGIVTAGPGQDDTATVLLRDADTAMYVAKRAGGGRAEIFRPEFRTRLLDRQEREAELRRAIADEQFELHYQPIVDLPTGAITGVEALIRWQHPERGMLPPGPVIQLAEDTGLIIPLGEWALRTACRQSALWTAQGVQLRISVNISAGQLYETDFVGTVRNTLAETGASADRIMLELTESTLMHSSALTVLRDIQDLGVRIALDDFGTGYSSLSYLQTHPFDVIKVDRSFVLQLGSTATAEGIVRCVLQLASVLGTPVVAEGVETPEQARFLLQAGCALAQGYLFGKPAPPAELARSLTASSTI